MAEIVYYKKTCLQICLQKRRQGEDKETFEWMTSFKRGQDEEMTDV